MKGFFCAGRIRSTAPGVGVSSVHTEYKSGQNYASGNGIGYGAVAYFLAQYVMWEVYQQCFVIFDEPEIYLNPQTQRKIHKLVSNMAQTSQVMVATNSPYFVSWSDFSNGATLVRMNRISRAEVGVFQLISRARYFGIFDSLPTDWQRPHVFDTVAKEVFFSDRVLFVEGQEDAGLIKKFVYENSLEISYEIFGYGSGGADNIFHLLSLARDMGIMASAIFDGDKVKDAERCTAEFPNFLIQVLPTKDIRDKTIIRKKIEEKIVGMFDERGQLKLEWHSKFSSIVLAPQRYFERIETELAHSVP